MKKRTKVIIYIVLILLLLFALVKSAKAEVQEPVREITNCVYGDSVTPEVCDKLTEDNKPKPKPVQVPTPQPVIKLEPFEGK